MSFSDLVSGGPSCGPSNPLQTLGKRFGQDRSSQMDRFEGEGGNGTPSEAAMRASFREQHGRNEPAFFQQPGPSARAFDLQPLQGALPHVQANNRSSPNPAADMHGAWQQRHTDHFQRTFRHGTPPVGAAADTRWAQEYSPGGSAMSNGVAPQQQQQQQQQHQQQHHPMMQGAGHAPMLYRSRMNGMYGAPHDTPMSSMQQPSTYNEVQLTGQSTQWDSAFSEIEQRSKSASPATMEAQPAILPATTEQTQRSVVDPKDADELARTAGRLVSTVEHDQSNKFKQSNFLNLMRKIRDRQAGIQGTDIVESESAAVGAAADDVVVTDKGKGRALDPTSLIPINQMDAMRPRMASASASSTTTARTAMPIDLTEETLGRQELNELWAEEDARSEAIEQEAMNRMAFVGDGGDVDRLRAEDEAEFNKYQNLLGAHLGPAAAGLKNAQRNLSSMEEQFDDELEGADFVGKRWQGSQGRGIPGMQSGEWDKLQADWDTWQAGSAGLQQNRDAPQSAATAPTYHFHAYNPYVGAAINNAARQFNAASLPPDMQSVLEREAEVQRDPNNAAAWLELGVKQQENERESLAIAALHRAIQLDPTVRDAWLALAVSYTNETDRSAALEAVERWVDATPEYRAIVREHRQANGETTTTSKASQLPIERHEQVTKLLIALARHSSTEGKIDADIQVALGVLFNASEDYDKAVDCFTTALQVRPDDWLMYNRLGATLSNSGRSAEALRYYQHALDLKPGFVRCHFNMSISCLNLQMYRQAALHIYTALTLQSESVDLSQDAVAREQSNLLGSGVNGVTSSSLWETLRVACELMDRPDLANYAVQRDLDRFDPSEFFSPNEDVAGGAMEPTV